MEMLSEYFNIILFSIMLFIHFSAEEKKQNLTTTKCALVLRRLEICRRHNKTEMHQLFLWVFLSFLSGTAWREKKTMKISIVVIQIDVIAL